MDERTTTVHFVPGRVNLIGEHTDYNGGLALPFATPMGTTATVTRGADTKVSISSSEHGAWREGSPTPDEWSALAAAVVARLRPSPRAIGVHSDLPIGAGLSSSASYVGALALACAAARDPDTLAPFIQQCEHDIGRTVGLLDPLAVLCSRRGCALLIDFSTGERRDVPVPDNIAFTVVDTGVRRSLVNSPYRERQSECREGLARLGAWQHATLAEVAAIPDVAQRRRARHVVTEQQRVRAAVKALAAGDGAELGEIVTAAHWSLSRDFEASTPAIDELVHAITSLDGVWGARLTGGGFGGCVLVVHGPEWTAPVWTAAQWPVAPSAGALRKED